MLRTIAGRLHAARGLTLPVILALSMIAALALVGTADAARDKTAPTAPSNLTATAGDQKVALTWGASTDNVGVKGYRVYRGGSQIATTSGTSYTNTGLTNGTTYSYTVKAYDQTNNLSAASNTATAAPTGTTATLPDTTITSVNDPQNWVDSNNDGGNSITVNFTGTNASSYQCSYTDSWYPSGTGWTNCTSPWSAWIGVGNATVSVRGVNAAGPDPSPATYSFTIQSGSSTPPSTLPACSDGIDNDGDGKIDYPADPGCTSATDTDETDPSSGGGSGVDPSGESVPAGDLPGWKQIYSDDFGQSVPLGSFPSAVSGKWGAYPWPWTGTPTWAKYNPEKTTSVANGMMDIWLHSEVINGNREYLISAPYPKINGANADNNQLYGRYAIRFKTDNFPQYHASWLLWPKSENWPTDGEIDFPEADFNSTIGGFMHRQNGTSGGDQDGYSTSTPIYGAWHTAVIEWLPTRCTFILDGKVIGNSTSRIPNTPMHWVIQNGGSFGVSNPDPNVQGHIYIDWVSVYRPA